MNQKGAIPLLLLVAGVGLVVALGAISIGPFKDNLLSSLNPKPNSQASGVFETYSATLTPVAGTGSSGSGKYTFDLLCSPEVSGSFAGQYLAYPKTQAPDTFVTGLLGNPYNAHIHYTSSSAPMKGIIIKNDPPPSVIPDVQWLSQITIANTDTPSAFSESERNEVRYQPVNGRPGTWVNIHTNACPTCQSGELQGDVIRISGDCDTTPSASPSPSQIPSPVPTPSISNEGDVDGNNKVDIFDYNTLLTAFGQTGSNLSADVDKNGKIDIFDYNILLTNFGKNYPPSPTPSASAAVIATIAGVPVCTDHDPTIWHSLTKKDVGGNITCTYGHHHADDPSQLDSLFGLAGSWWGNPGHAVGYPWVTSTAENTQKHNLFKIIVRKDLTPQMTQGQDGNVGTGNYIKNFRSWTHSVGSGGNLGGGYTSKDGFQSQVHSFAVEAQICSKDHNCGTIKIGGYQDIGLGMLLLPGFDTEQCVLPNAFLPGSCDEQLNSGLSPRHIHGSIDHPRGDYTWYAATSPTYRRKNSPKVLDHINVDFGTIAGGAWAQVDPNNFDSLVFSSGNGNGEYMSQEILGFSFYDWSPGAANGRVNFDGFTDNWGNVYRSLADCQSDNSPACVPLKVNNIPVGYEVYRDSAYEAATGIRPAKYYDETVMVNGTRKSLTAYPN